MKNKMYIMVKNYLTLLYIKIGAKTDRCICINESWKVNKSDISIHPYLSEKQYVTHLSDLR